VVPGKGVGMKLYEVADEIVAIFERAEAQGGAIEDADLEALTALQMEFRGKVENCAMMVRNWEGQAAVLRTEATRLAERARAHEARATRLKDYLLKHLQSTETKKVEGRILSVRRQFNPPSCEVLDEGLVPDQFKELTPVVDKKAILNAWREAQDSGQEFHVPGATVRRLEGLRIQ